jgi:MFS transporter, OFA family, oxalate/formate antiporter
MNLKSRRWVYLAIGTMVNIVIGQTYAWSVFVNPLSDHFTWSRTDISVAFAIFHTISSIPIILAGKIQDYVQPKHVILAGGVIYGLGMMGVGYVDSLPGLYVTYGAMGGISMGTIYSGVMPNLVRFFPDRRGLAAGILAAGVGSGAVIWAPIAAHLIGDVGVLPTFKILGTVYLVVLCGSAPFIGTAPAGFVPQGWKQSRAVREVADAPDKDWRRMMSDPIFFCLAAIIAAGAMAGLMIIAHASPILQTVGGYSAITAGSWVGVLALFNSAGRLGWGFVSDRIGRPPALIIIYAILSTTMLWLASMPLEVVMPLLIVGSCFGGLMGMIAPLTADCFGPKHLAMNFGILFSPFAIGAFIGPRLAGVIMNETGSYSRAFLMAGILSFVAVGLALLARTTLQRRRTAAAAEIMARPASEA